MSATLTRMPRSGSTSISAPDLLKLIQPGGKSGFLRVKTQTKIVKSIKWRHRFVVLATNAIYFYENERSETSDLSIALLGYLAVQRETTSLCAWAFTLIPGVKSLPQKSFACSSEADRKEWMICIKENLYHANNVEKLHPQKIKARVQKIISCENTTQEEKEYLELEIPIKDDSMNTIDTDEPDSDDCDMIDDHHNKHKKQVDVTQRKAALLPPKANIRNENLKSQPDPSTTSSSQLPPPRYSAIVRGDEAQYENFNPKAVDNSDSDNQEDLEKKCTIVDEKMCRDREQCIRLLKTTNKLGTYLIRKSREQIKNYKVLAVLGQNDIVREYKIELSPDGVFRFNLRSDGQHEFDSMNALLNHFSKEEKLPNSGTYLAYGIHEIHEDTEQLYEQPSDDY